MLDVVYLAEEVAPMVAAHLVALGEVGRAVAAGEAVGVEQGVPDLAGPVRLREDQLAGGTARPKHAVEVGAAVELAKLGEA